MPYADSRGYAVVATLCFSFFFSCPGGEVPIVSFLCFGLSLVAVTMKAGADKACILTRLTTNQPMPVVTRKRGRGGAGCSEYSQAEL